jgi:tripartite-type tricarboxylate transporter receptor subunit TctC
MRHAASLAFALTLATFSASGRSHAADVSFAGQKINVVIGWGVGGGYDIYGRVIARFLGKYLPGNPMVIPQNMTGAGSLRAADYIYNIAPKDGTVVGVIGQSIPVDQLMEGGPKPFDASKFTWIGRMASSVETITVWHTSKVQSIEDAKNQVANIAATGASASSAIYPVVLNNLLGTKFTVVSGYDGTKEMLISMERGETDGCGALNVSTLTSEFPHWLKERKVKVITQVSLERHPAMPDAPTIVELGRDDREKQIMKLFAASGDIGRALVAPPNLPPERAAALRDAFMKAMSDPELLEFARNNNLDISPMEGGTLQKLVADIGATSPDIIKAAKAAKNPEN